MTTGSSSAWPRKRSSGPPGPRRIQSPERSGVGSAVMQAIPKLSAEFLTNFDRFNLSAQEGYLVSLIDGRMDISKLLILSPFDPFTTLFNLAKLEYERAISVPQ